MDDGRRDLSIPARGLVALRRALRKEAGPLATIHTLHTAGFAAGEALFPRVADVVGDGGDVGGRSEDDFWTGLSDLLSERGWGTVSHESVHDAVGVLGSTDWAEVGDEAEEETQPSCAFSTGMFAAVLSLAAGEPVAVVEVECRAAGDEACRFAFGSEVAIHELYGRLLENRDLEAALGSL